MKKELMKCMENNRNKISFGRSIYPNLDREVLIDILEEMKAARQCVAFTSFQLQEFPMQIEQMMEFIELTVSYGVNVIPDIAHKDLTKENIRKLEFKTNNDRAEALSLVLSFESINDEFEFFVNR